METDKNNDNLLGSNYLTGTNIYWNAFLLFIFVVN